MIAIGAVHQQHRRHLDDGVGGKVDGREHAATAE